MLVLEREIEQIIHVGPDITIKVLAMKFGLVPKVWIGIQAPADVAITRPDAKVLHPITRRVRSMGSRG